MKDRKINSRLEEDDSCLKEPQTPNCISYMSDEEHYTLVFKRMAEVKRSLKIATAELKNYSVSDGVRLCDFFQTLVERGVHVQVISMKPFAFYKYTKEYCPKLLESPLFELRYNRHNHMKIFVFDDEWAYIGSADVTSASIGRRTSRKRNYEAGMLVWGPLMVQAPLRHFEKAWNDTDSLKHTWKRFAKLVKD